MCLGLGNGCVAPKEKKGLSLVKPYTNADKINDMSIEEKAEFIAALTQYCDPFDCDDCPLKDLSVCSKDGIKQWLESEATHGGKGV